ncbi:MAG: DUF4410 domain-containing protein [Elusimicrobia bacterium]|nr:DUF4410 domain-containing protein [Elusimicrobiota bacterium]
MVVGVGVSGCAPEAIAAVGAISPTSSAKFQQVIIGDFGGEKLPGQANLVLSRLVERRLKLKGLFRSVVLAIEVHSPEPSSVTVIGTVTEITEGNRFLQWFLGFGAGAPEAAGNFKLIDSGGKDLFQFSVSTYAGGLKIGVPSMEELLDGLASLVAEQIAKWVRGEASQQMGESENLP